MHARFEWSRDVEDQVMGLSDLRLCVIVFNSVKGSVSWGLCCRVRSYLEVVNHRGYFLIIRTSLFLPEGLMGTVFWSASDSDRLELCPNSRGADGLSTSAISSMTSQVAPENIHRVRLTQRHRQASELWDIEATLRDSHTELRRRRA